MMYPLIRIFPLRGIGGDVERVGRSRGRRKPRHEDKNPERRVEMEKLLQFYESVASWLRSEKGQTIIEYVLVIVLISLVIILVVAGPESPIYNGLSNAAEGLEEKLTP
jgi:Flp pilus assembly pilin Flp